MGTTAPSMLYLVNGSANDVEIELLDDRDQPENLAGITPLEFAVRTAFGAGGVDLIRKDQPGDFTVAANVVTVAIDQTDADALRVGRFVAGLKVQLDATGEVFWTDPFHVDVVEQTT